MDNKRAQTMQTAPQNLLMIFGIVFVIGAAAISLDTFRDNSAAPAKGSAVDTNDTFTALDTFSVQFANLALHKDAVAESCSNVYFMNITGQNVTGKFTVSGCNATLADSTQDSTTMTANYTYQYYQYGYAYNTSSKGLAAVTNFSLQLPTVGTMLGVGIFMALIIGIFVVVRRKSE